jgi:hypothetical protein
MSSEGWPEDAKDHERPWVFVHCSHEKSSISIGRAQLFYPFLDDLVLKIGLHRISSTPLSECLTDFPVGHLLPVAIARLLVA